MSKGRVYLIPSFLHEDAANTIPGYVIDAVKDCQVFFVENERSARRYLKKIWREINIDSYKWFAIHKAEDSLLKEFTGILESGSNIGIISEAGCPGVADPGQILVETAQKISATVTPLVGPNSILLALMASGMNGQNFHFNGYLPIEQVNRRKMLQQLETDSGKKQCTEIFIETPYRNDQVLADIFQCCNGSTRLCIAVDITAASESIKTKSINQWKKDPPSLHKKLVIFLLQA